MAAIGQFFSLVGMMADADLELAERERRGLGRWMQALVPALSQKPDLNPGVLADVRFGSPGSTWRPCGHKGTLHAPKWKIEPRCLIWPAIGDDEFVPLDDHNRREKFVFGNCIECRFQPRHRFLLVPIPGSKEDQARSVGFGQRYQSWKIEVCRNHDPTLSASMRQNCFIGTTRDIPIFEACTASWPWSTSQSGERWR
jgi:hypothetical protein